MPSLGDLTVQLGAVTGQFHSDISSAENRLKGLGSAMRGVINQAGKIGIAAGAAGAAVLAHFVNTGMKAVDAQTKLARTLGATQDGLRGLQIAAQDAGVDTNLMNSALERMQARLGEAIREPASRAAEAMQALGLSASELANMDVDERFATIADRVRDMGLNAAQTADVLRQFGIRNAELINLLRDGGDAIRSARQEVDEFGLSISEVDAAKIEMANDAMARIGRHLEGIRNQFAIAVAPILLEIANRINNVAREHGGWADVAANVAEKVIRGFGKVLDVVQGIRVAFKGAELLVVSFGAASISVAQLAANGFAKFVDGVIEGVNIAIEALNKLPKVDIATVDPISDSAFMDGLNQMAEDARNKVGEVRAELHELAMQEMPSSRFEKFLDAVRQRSQEAAEEVVRLRHEMGAGAEGFMEEFSQDFERERSEDEQNRKSVEARLQAIRDGLMEEEELVAEHYKRDLEALREALELKLLTEEEFADLRRQLEEDLMSDLADIRERGMSELEKFTTSSFKNQAKTVASELANMTAGVANQSKRMFAINKAAGIANAIINTAEGVTKALSAYPPPISFAMAAAQAAAGAAQIQSIKAQQFGGGGAAPSLAGSTPAPPVTPVSDGSGPSQQRTMVVKGLDPNSLFSGRQLRSLAEAMIEFQKDGGKVVLQ